MSALRLIIGNKNYSSWSLRPWLALKMGGFGFTEEVIPLFENGFVEAMDAHSPSRKVPVLIHGDLTVWESLAICEYLAELKPEAYLWPDDMEIRARARSVATEMAAGMTGVRNAMPMNVRRRVETFEPDAAARKDIRRILDIWEDCLARKQGDGPFLFGHFTIADAMYAPVVTRFQTYGINVDGTCRRYMDAVLSLDPMQEWAEAAADEPWVIERVEL